MGLKGEKLGARIPFSLHSISGKNWTRFYYCYVITCMFPSADEGSPSCEEGLVDSQLPPQTSPTSTDDTLGMFEVVESWLLHI